MNRRIPPMLPRYLVQTGFLLLLLWSGIRFAGWVEHVRQGTPPPFERPAVIDGFLPISGLMNLRHWVQSGEFFPVHPAAALILLAALLTGVLLKRSFCSWVCPVFPLSEGLWRLGEKLFGRNFAPPFWLDVPLRGLKYLLLLFFSWQILWLMPFSALRQFLAAPYHLIADIRLLNFFLDPSALTLAVLGALAVLCLFVQMAWCRYLCPYGALLGLASLFSLAKIHRNERSCSRCGLCSSRCPAWLPVRERKTVRSPECYACFRCVQGCPSQGTVEMRAAGRLPLPSALFALLVIAVFIGVDLYGRATGQWQGPTSWQEIALLLRRSF